MRLSEYGPNESPRAPPRPLWRILLDQLSSIVVLLLIAAVAAAASVGDIAEASAIAAVLAINVAIGFITEMRARRALDALLSFEVPRTRVVRDGAIAEIDARTVVPGDVILVEQGDMVPADARLLEAAELRTDEAALTGESLPVEKIAGAIAEEDAPLAERPGMLYKGTSIVGGRARAVVAATGEATEIGRIGGMVRDIAEERTPLQRRLDALGRRLILVALAAGAVVAVLGGVRGAPWGTMIETGLALAIAAVPEGLPATITIALAVGIRRMARRRALTRRITAVESLGAATIICTDKTGTLTAGRQTITAIHTRDGDVQIDPGTTRLEATFRRDNATFDPLGDGVVRRLLVAGAAANEASLEVDDGDVRVVGDPTDGAFLIAARQAGLDAPADPAERVPFSTERRFAASFHRDEGTSWIVRVKGAPEAVLERCARIASEHGESPMDNALREAVLAANHDMAGRGLRVLALADGSVDGASADAVTGLVFLGLAGMIDPPAEGVPETIAAFRRAGIRTVMITGDQKRTAEAIGSELGIGGGAREGRELASLDADQLASAIADVSVFSRVSPEDKLRLVDALRASGEVVAMLGDGVNDAAALRRADVGVAMGGRGTDVARQAADVVLEDDRFPTIGAAIEEGRVIYDNIRKFVFYLFSCNLAEILVLVGAGIAGLPLPLAPLQILWLNLVTDTFPALSLAMEPGEADIMERPPRDPARNILSAGMVRLIVLWGLLLGAVSMAAYLWSLGGDIERTRTVTFMVLALAQVFHLGTARSTESLRGRHTGNRWALGAVVLVVALQLAAVYVPPLARLLDLVPPSPTDWAVITGLSVLPAVIGLVIKMRRRP